MPTNTKTPSLLLVEDSEDDAFFFRRTLQKSGHQCAVFRVKDGAEALEFLENAAASDSLPHVIFLDLKMPLLNGFEVLEWLRSQAFASQLRVIVLSGSENQSDIDRAARLGAVHYLVKPIRRHDLDRFLQDICPANPQMGACV